MKKRIIRTSIVLVAIAYAVALTGCGGSRVKATFGDSVRSDVQAQIYDHEAASNPPRDPVDGTDGQRMEAVMEEHRGQTGSAENVSNPIVINVGQ